MDTYLRDICLQWCRRSPTGQSRTVLTGLAFSPLPHGFVADDDTTFSQEFFHLAEAKAKAMIQPDGVGDYFGRETVLSI